MVALGVGSAGIVGISAGVAFKWFFARRLRRKALQVEPITVKPSVTVAP